MNKDEHDLVEHLPIDRDAMFIECEGDYMCVAVVRTNGGIVVDIWPSHNQADDTLATAYAFRGDAKSAVEQLERGDQ